jgi:hypothetical protein
VRRRAHFKWIGQKGAKKLISKSKIKSIYLSGNLNYIFGFTPNTLAYFIELKREEKQVLPPTLWLPNLYFTEIANVVNSLFKITLW